MQGFRTTCAAAKTGVFELDSSVGPSLTCVRSLDRTRLGGLTPGCPSGTTHGIAAMSSRLTPSHELPLCADISEAGQSNAGCAPPTFRDCTHLHPLRAATSFHLLRAGFSSHTRSISYRLGSCKKGTPGDPRASWEPLFLIPCTSCFPLPAAHKDGGAPRRRINSHTCRLWKGKHDARDLWQVNDFLKAAV